jgi:hypothetical protein
VRATVVLLACVALLAPTASAAAIVPQQGIAGVGIGMSRAEVEAALGAPLRAVRGSNDFGRFTELVYPHLVRVTLQGDEAVTAVRTTGRFERTAAGVGVGSTIGAVRARVDRVRCRTELGFRHCFVGRFVPGARVTDFAIRDGRVVRVVVGVVID